MLFKKLVHHISLWRLNFWKLLKIHCWLEIALFANFDRMRTTSYLLWIHRGLLHILSLPKHMLPVHQPAKQIEKKKSKESGDENNGMLFPKLFWPTVRKNCSSDREKPLKYVTKGNFLQQNAFLTCSWRLLRTNRYIRTVIIQIEKNGI